MSGLVHDAHIAAGASLPPLLAVTVVAGSYVVLAARQRRKAVSWSGWRTASFLGGCGVVAMAVLPDLSPYPAGDFRGHMIQHLLIGMVAPTGLALGAPASLLLRSLPNRGRRAAAAVLRSRAVHILTHAATIVTLNIGGLVALYATPLDAVMDSSPAAHHLVHLHFIVSGYVFAWLIAGRDPMLRVVGPVSTATFFVDDHVPLSMFGPGPSAGRVHGYGRYGVIVRGTACCESCSRRTTSRRRGSCPSPLRCWS